jgi:hypothetical protein
MVTKVRQNKDNTMICKVDTIMVTKLSSGPEALYGEKLLKSMQLLFPYYLF